MIRARTALLLACVVSLSGCQTFRSFEKGCPGIYSGARYYGDQLGEIPFDGVIFFTMDLPLTLIFDTLALPGTAFAHPEEPPGGFPPGCRWVTRQRRS